VCALGPTFVLVGSGEGLPRDGGTEPGQRWQAGQPAQRTAQMEAINTDRPGTRF
jgi:hypothetical protein